MLELVISAVGVPMFTFAVIAVPTLVVILVVLIVRRKNKEKAQVREFIDSNNALQEEENLEDWEEELEKEDVALEFSDWDNKVIVDDYDTDKEDSKSRVEVVGNNNTIEVTERVYVQELESVLATPGYPSDTTPSYSSSSDNDSGDSSSSDSSSDSNSN